MSNPEWRTTHVTSRIDGEIRLAHVLTCTNCDDTRWHLLRVGDGEHEHMQCVGCGNMYCDGSCVDTTDE